MPALQTKSKMQSLLNASFEFPQDSIPKKLVD
jgi:hypothetical protein